jgi:site-specific recombinase XerD
VRALCAWLADQRYLPSNPWQAPATASPAGRTAAQAIGATRRPLRALSAGQWAQLQAWADRLPASLASARVQCLLAVAGSTGMRLSELAQATLAWLHPTPTPSILIHGKQQQARCVPLTRPAVAALRRYLAARNLPTDLSRLPAHAPLVARLHGERALSATRLYEVVGEAFADAAQALAQQDGAAAQALRQASTHWLRHTFALQSARRGAPAAELQALLGHKRAATTRIYRRTAAEQSSTG